MVGIWRSSIRAFKKATGITSITGKKANVHQYDDEEAIIWETECWDANAKKWIPFNTPENPGPYKFENGGVSNTFPSDSMYLSKLGHGYAFEDDSEWVCGEWVDQDTDQTTTSQGDKPSLRRRCWLRNLIFREGSDLEAALATVRREAAGASRRDSRTGARRDSVKRRPSGTSFANDMNVSKARAFLGLQESDSSPVNSPGASREASTPSIATGALTPVTPASESVPDNSTSAASKLFAATEPVTPQSSVSTPTFGTKAIGGGQGGTGRYVPDVPADGKLDKTYYISSSKVAALSKEIKLLEIESIKWFENEKAEWKRVQYPVMQAQILELESRVARLKDRLGEEINIAGIEHAQMLEKEIAAHTDALEDVKKNFYFPHSTVALGAAGNYIAFDDMWLEHLNGYINFEVQPDREFPTIRLSLSGEGLDNENIVDANEPVETDRSKADCARGLEVRFKVEKFMSNGDKGAKIPKISLPSMKITLEVKVDLNLNYDVKKEEWKCDSTSLIIDLIAFRGPFGMRKSMVAAAFPIIKPLIRKAILKAMPKELGAFILSLPSPIELHGSFSFQGVQLAKLKEDMLTSEFVKGLCSLSTLQMGMFRVLQSHTMERGYKDVLKDVYQVIKYVRTHKRNGKIWRNMCALWESCCQLYCEEVRNIFMKKAEELRVVPSMHTFEVTFAAVMKGAEEISRKKMNVSIQMQQIEGAFSLNKALRCLMQFLYRSTFEQGIADMESTKKAEESWFNRGAVASNKYNVDSGAVKKARTILLLNKIKKDYKAAQDWIKIMCRNFDFADTKFRMLACSGPDGNIFWEIMKLFVQFPLLVDSGIAQDKVIWGTLVPFKVDVKARESGDINMQVSHVLNLHLDDQASEDDGSTGEIDAPPTPQEMQAQAYAHRINGQFDDDDSEDDFISPEDENALLEISARKPHISMIVDQKSTLKPGAELFSLLIGPKDAHKKPFGTPDMIQAQKEAEDRYARDSLLPLFDEDDEELLDSEAFNTPFADDEEEILPLTSSNIEVWEQINAKSVSESNSKANSMAGKKKRESFHEKIQRRHSARSGRSGKRGNGGFLGFDDPDATCPLFLQTAPGIKLLMQIPKIDLRIYMSSLMRFIGAHFQDMSALKEWLEDTFGGEFLEEHLYQFQTQLERFTKYLIQPGMTLETNLNVKVTAQACEVLVRINTPDLSLPEFVEKDNFGDANRDESPTTNADDKAAGDINVADDGGNTDSLTGKVESNTSNHDESQPKATANVESSDKTADLAPVDTAVGSKPEFPQPLSLEIPNILRNDKDFIPKPLLIEKTQFPTGNKDQDGDDVLPQAHAFRLEMSFNVLDILEDMQAINRVVNEAKAASVERAQEKAEALLFIRQQNEKSEANSPAR